MTDLQQQVRGWAEEYRTERLPRRVFVRRVLAIAGTVPAGLALLNEVGIAADAAEISQAQQIEKSSRRPAGEVPRCSFCTKRQNEVTKLIAGLTVFICDECVEVCNDMIADDNRCHPAPAPCVLCGRWSNGVWVARQQVCRGCTKRAARALLNDIHDESIHYLMRSVAVDVIDRA